jgi:hypothetical protein
VQSFAAHGKCLTNFQIIVVSGMPQHYDAIIIGAGDGLTCSDTHLG